MMQYRAEVDGLRAVAVLPVIFFHAGVDAFSGGYVGVDVFFVISGYLITTIIMAELSNGGFSIAGFYERRARRILPALFLVTVVSFAIGWFLLLPDAMQDFSRSLVAVSLFSSNIFFWFQSGYFDTASEYKPLLHTWSLAVEEQYYILFPLVLMILWRFGYRWILLVLGLLGVASLVLSHWGAHTHQSAAFYLLPTRGWELLVGSFAAIMLSKYGLRESRIQNELGSLLGMTLIILSIVSFDERTPFPGAYALIPTLGALLVILCATPGTMVGHVLTRRAIVGIGLISYSAYLWHQPLLAFARHRHPGEPDDYLLIGLAVASLFLAYVSWRYVEMPFRDKRRFSRGTIFVFSLTGIVIMAAIGLAGAANGFTQLRFSDDTAARAAVLQSEIRPRIRCDQDYHEVDPKPCIVGAVESESIVVAVGDSHMGQWLDVLDEIGSENRIQFRVYSKSACANANVSYFYGALRRVYHECEVWRGKLVAEIDRLDPKLVFLTNSSAGYVRLDGGMPNLEQWQKGVGEFVQQITGGKRRVIWLIDNPRFVEYNPFHCYQRHLWLNEDSFEECSASRTSVLKSEIVSAEIQALKGISSTSVLDFTDFYCDANTCRSIVSGQPLMRDTNHLTRPATFMLKERLAESLLLDR